MAKYVVEFSPPEKIKREPYEETDSVINYRIVLAPFQKQTQVEFSNIKLKEIAVRFLTVVNPFEKPGQYVLPPPTDGVYFNMYKFNLEPNSECELTITWQPSEYGNMRKLVKIEQINNNRKYDFVILGNCCSPPYKKFKGAISNSKSKDVSMIRKQTYCSQKNITTNKIRNDSFISKQLSEPIYKETLQIPVRRQTYLVTEKENLPVSKHQVLCRNTILTSPERSLKRPDKKCQDQCFNNHFNLNLNKSLSPISDESPEKPFKITVNHYSKLDDFNLTPLQSTENLLSTLGTKNQFNQFDGQLSFDVTDESLASISSNSTQLKCANALNVPVTCTPIKYNPTNYNCNRFTKSPDTEMNKTFTSFGSDSIKSESNASFPGSDSIKSESNASFLEVEQLSGSMPMHSWSDVHSVHYSTMIASSNTSPKRPSFTIKSSPHYKCITKRMMYKSELRQCSTAQQTPITKASKLDKCDQYLQCLTSPELLYHNFAEDPFLKMSQYFEAEWLNRQELDMIRWINALLTPTDKLVDEEQSGDVEQAAMAWIEASKTSNENKPMQFATQKDLFAAQIYRQSPQQWKALRKATTNLFTSQNVAPILSKLTLLIEKDLITVRDDRQIHLDLSLKKKISDLLKCYNPLWLRIGLEAIYGQIVHVKPGSNDLDGVGWFVRKHLFNNDFVKKKFTKTTVLQVNLPAYNTSMKKFILRKIFMLMYFLDRAKEQQLIRHNPCLFKINSPYKSSYDLLMGFCADMVAAHGDIIRRLRSIGYTLNHKQTHLDEVNYAVKSLNDLRDGTRITRVVEILFKGSPLSHKLRLPAISKLQKIYNVNLALTRVSEHILIEGNISSRDIVDGHREKILSLFWQIIYKYLTPRYNNAAIKIQNWWRNSSLKLVVLKRIRAKEITKRHTAATKIQSLTRGYFMRKHWPCMKSELIKNREILHAASDKIKFYLKNKIKFLTNERIRFIILRKTVVLIQRKFRTKMLMVKERQTYLKLKESALTIQKYYRGFILRKNWPQIKKNMIAEKATKIAAINVIKRVLRKTLPLTEERIMYMKLRQNVLYIQRLFLAKRAMKLEMEYYTILKTTTVFVQQKFRANIAMQKDRKAFLKAKLSIVLIQRMFRGFLMRKNWPCLKNYLILEKKKHINAINIVKRALRRNLPLTQDRLNFLKLKNTVIYIEKLYSANKSMKIQMNHYVALKSATLFLQRQFRANIIMKREQHNYFKTKQSVLLIQKVFRGFIVRKHWPNMKSSLITEKKIRIKAMNIVKQALRRNLPVTQDRIDFVKLKNAVIFLQQKWRANKLMKIQSEWYKKSQYASIFVQRKFRANIFMQKEQENYLKAKSAALLIQKMYRGYLIRKKLPSLKFCLMLDKIKRADAANVIKRFIRNNLPPTQDRLYYEQLKRLTIIIQRRFRANIEMKVQRDKYRLLKSSTVVLQQRYLAKQAMETKRSWYQNLKICTIKLQSRVRGYLARKRWPELCAQLQASKLVLIQSANIVKRALRKQLPVTEDRIQFLKLKWSVAVIQQRIRTHIDTKRQRNKFLQLKATALGLQSVSRGYLFRQQQWPAMRIELDYARQQLIFQVNIIKRALRKNLVNRDRCQFLELQHATVMIQRAFRTRQQARKYQALRAAALTIQHKYRANTASTHQWNDFQHTKAAVIVLQSFCRGCLERRKWPETKQALLNHRQRLTMASNTIKKFLRQCLPVNPERSQYLALKHAVILIQIRYRAKIAARIVKTRYDQLKHYTIVLQRRFKMRIYVRAAVTVQSHIRGFLVRRQWPYLKECLLAKQKNSLEAQQKRYSAACKIQSSVRGYLTRKRLPELVNQHQTKKRLWAATKIQSLWRGYCVRKKYQKTYQCCQKIVQSVEGAPTLGKRHNDILNVLNQQKRNEYSYKELSTVFWNLDTCTSLSKELCMKTAGGIIVDHIFRFLQYSNQSQPSIEAREPAIRVLNNLLRYHETSWLIWTRTVNSGMVSELIKMMKTSCGKFGTTKKLYCLIATWIWIALQDPPKKEYIQNVPITIAHFKFMMNTLNKKYDTQKMDKKTMVLPSTRPTWYIGSKCQKCFESDFFATSQICKLLKIIK